MHRVDSDEHLGNKFQNANPPTTAGTLLEKDWHNAMQEDYSRLLEALGVTLAGSGSADQTAGWVSGREAILRRFRGADVRYYGADPTGASDSATAFTNAWAASPVILVPEGSFRIDSSITVPDWSMIIGMGAKSFMKVNHNGALLDIEDRRCVIRDLYFTYAAGSAGSSRHVKIKNTVTGFTIWVQNCTFQVDENVTGGLTGIEMDDEAGGSPLLVHNCRFQDQVKKGVGIRLGVDSSSKAAAAMITDCHFSNCDKNIEVNYGSADALGRIRGCHILDGDLEFNNAEGIHFEECTIDIDAYDFNNCEGVIFKDCYHPATLSNTIPTDAAAKASYFDFINCRTDDGFTQAEGVRGTNANGDDTTGMEAKIEIDADRTVPVSTVEIISSTNYTLSGSQRIGMNASQTKLILYNLANGQLIAGTGNGYFAVQAHIRIDPGSVAVGDISVRLRPVTSGESITVPFGYSDDGPGHLIFSGEYIFKLAKEETVVCDISNRDASNTFTVKGANPRDFFRIRQLR